MKWAEIRGHVAKHGPVPPERCPVCGGEIDRVVHTVDNNLRFVESNPAVGAMMAAFMAPDDEKAEAWARALEVPWQPKMIAVAGPIETTFDLQCERGHELKYLAGTLTRVDGLAEGEQAPLG